MKFELLQSKRTRPFGILVILHVLIGVSLILIELLTDFILWQTPDFRSLGFAILILVDGYLWQKIGKKVESDVFPFLDLGVLLLVYIELILF